MPDYEIWRSTGGGQMLLGDQYRDSDLSPAELAQRQAASVGSWAYAPGTLVAIVAKGGIGPSTSVSLFRVEAVPPKPQPSVRVVPA